MADLIRLDLNNGQTMWTGISNGSVAHAVLPTGVEVYAVPVLTEHVQGVKLVDRSGDFLGAAWSIR